MLGAWRFLLSLLVVVHHLCHGVAPVSGAYAVFAFYTVSGFLMTRILNGAYAGVGGFFRYLANRALRIYPVYFACMGLSLIVIRLWPATAQTSNPSMVWPTSAESWAYQFTIVGLLDYPQRLIPPAWSLHLELVFYIVMGVLLSQNRWITRLWFVASWAYAAYLLFTGQHFKSMYYTPAGVSAAFATGALLWFEGRHLRMRFATWQTLLSVLLFLLWTFGFYRLFRWPYPLTTLLYSSIPLGTYVLLCLDKIDRHAVHPFARRLDRLLGNLAYPIFLIHWPVAAIVRQATGLPTSSLQLFFYSLLPTLLLAGVIHYAIERPIEHIRARVRYTPASST